MTSHDSARLRTAFIAGLIAVVQGCSPPDEPGELREAETPEPEEVVGDVDDVPTTVSDESLLAWNATLDAGAGDAAAVQVIDVDDGLGLRAGGASLAWRPADLAESGDFTVSADFTPTGTPPAADAAYGVFVGGMHLDAPDRSYLAFLVRGDGKYRIERRTGEERKALVDWSANPAIGGAQAGSVPLTGLAVRVEGDQVHFLANGKVVHSLPVAEARPHGIAGLRAEQGVDLQVKNWTVSGAGAA